MAVDDLFDPLQESLDDQTKVDCFIALGIPKRNETKCHATCHRSRSGFQSLDCNGHEPRIDNFVDDPLAILLSRTPRHERREILVERVVARDGMKTGHEP